MRAKHICTSTKNWPLQGSRYVGACPCLVHTCFLCDIHRKQHGRAFSAPHRGPTGALRAPVVFVSFITQKQVRTKHGYAPKNLLPWNFGYSTSSSATASSSNLRLCSISQIAMCVPYSESVRTTVESSVMFLIHPEKHNSSLTHLNAHLEQAKRKPK
jgi:hypothetical protein